MSKGTLSKHPSRYPQGYPQLLATGDKCWVWDTHANRYLDLSMGLAGVGLFGHSYDPIVNAVRIAAKRGTLFHLPCSSEKLATEELLQFLSQEWAEDVRFGLNGTDVTAAAVRLARAVAGTAPIVTFRGAYHGASGADWFAAGQEPARGIDLDNVIAPTMREWNDASALASVGYPVAGVIFEVGNEAPTPEFIDALHAYRNKTQCVLIADEVVTGFRLHKAGACGLYGIKPDLACYGKALGSGVPISALVGRRDLMREFDLVHTSEPVFMSYTHAANALSLAAMRVTLSELTRTNAIETVWTHGKAMIEMFERLVGVHELRTTAYAAGQSPRHCWRFRDAGSIPATTLHALFQQQMCKHNVLVGVANCPTIFHDDGFARLERALDASLEVIARAIKQQSVNGLLEGEVPKQLYVRTA